MQLNLAGTETYILPSIEDVEKELKVSPNLKLIKQRIADVLQVLGDFTNRRELGRYVFPNGSYYRVHTMQFFSLLSVFVFQHESTYLLTFKFELLSDSSILFITETYTLPSADVKKELTLSSKPKSVQLS